MTLMGRASHTTHYLFAIYLQYVHKGCTIELWHIWLYKFIYIRE